MKHPDRLTAEQYREMQKPKKKPVARWGKSGPTESQQQAAQILIGIDPGSVVTGFAILKEGEPPVLKGFKSHCEAILFAWAFVQQVGQQNIHFVVEDARKAKKNAWFAKQNGTSKNKGAGYVMALSKDWEMFCEFLKVPYTLKAPNSALTKWEPERFEQAYGIKTRKGEHHLRDAYNLIAA